MGKARKRRLLTGTMVLAVVLAGLTAGHGLGLLEFSSLSIAGAEQPGLAAKGDTYTMGAQPERNTGEHSELHVGVSDEAGVAVSYLRFAIPGVGEPTGAAVQLSLVEPGAAGLLEISQVDPAWSESGLTAAEAPPLGRVLDTKVVQADARTVEFDVSQAVRPGRIASFAITTPATGTLWRMHSRESGDGAPSLRLELPPVGIRTPGQPDQAIGAEPTRPPVTGPVEAVPVGEEPCETDDLLVPSCGALLGVAPGAHVPGSKTEALLRFEELTGRQQHIYHAYHRGSGDLFPTPDQIAIATDPQRPRALFLNWKPTDVSWADIAAGDPETDAYLDELAQHIATQFDRPMFFTVHHEPENDVVPEAGSGYTATDYADMFRHVVERLRVGGADKLVTVMVYMAYLKWTAEPWHGDLYPGDDVVDWVGWDTYGYSEPGHGFGDFAELVNRVSGANPQWPGFYNWAAVTFPDKPLMIAEWGVWYSEDNPLHQAKVFEDATDQLSHFPRLKAVVYFESENAEGRDSRVHNEPGGLDAYRTLADSKTFAAKLRS